MRDGDIHSFLLRFAHIAEMTYHENMAGKDYLRSFKADLKSLKSLSVDAMDDNRGMEMDSNFKENDEDRDEIILALTLIKEKIDPLFKKYKIN